MADRLSGSSVRCDSCVPLRGGRGGPVGSDTAGPGHVVPTKPGVGVPARSRVPTQAAALRGAPTRTTSEAGQQCVIAGRVVNGVLGVTEGGVFTRLRKSASGFCDGLSRDHLPFTVNVYVYGASVGSRVMPGALRGWRLIAATADHRERVHQLGD